MKRVLAAICLGAMACAAASTASAQSYQPANPLDALFGALLGQPSGRPMVRRQGPPPVYRDGRDYSRQQYRERRRLARQGYNPRRRALDYEQDWGFAPDERFESRRVERQFAPWPRVRTNGARQEARQPRQRVARATPATYTPDPKFMKQTVAYDGGYAAGTIVVDTNQRFLFFVQGDGTALRYGIGVGRAGFEWNGTADVQRKAEWPAWHPPAEMRKREPWLPEKMEGGEQNPLGARALYLYKGGKDTLYRIHGTNKPSSIGQALSSGCIRMLNDDVTDLYDRVGLGTKVVVL